MGKILRLLVGWPIIIGIYLLFLVLYIPTIMVEMALQLQRFVGDLGCWIAGQHSYDMFGAFLLADKHDIRKLKCTACGHVIAEKEVPVIEQQLDIWLKSISVLTEQLKHQRVAADLGKLDAS